MNIKYVSWLIKTTRFMIKVMIIKMITNCLYIITQRFDLDTKDKTKHETGTWLVNVHSVSRNVSIFSC